jgi:hypothetical protein
MPKHIDIVFDGPPDATCGRLIEVEDDTGHSIRFGQWIERSDGRWVLRITAGAFDHIHPQKPKVI